MKRRKRRRSCLAFLKLASLNLLVNRSPTTENRASCPTLQQPAATPRMASAIADMETFELTCSDSLAPTALASPSPCLFPLQLAAPSWHGRRTRQRLDTRNRNLPQR
eukprot:755600-Hanusia_phi.AAC.1